MGVDDTDDVMSGTKTCPVQDSKSEKLSDAESPVVTMESSPASSPVKSNDDALPKMTNSPSPSADSPLESEPPKTSAKNRVNVILSDSDDDEDEVIPAKSKSKPSAASGLTDDEDDDKDESVNTRKSVVNDGNSTADKSKNAVKDGPSTGLTDSESESESDDVMAKKQPAKVRMQS